VLGRVSWLPYVAAQVIATVLVLVWNFVGNSIWTFAHRGEPK
jgi:putative flippase GtrA